MTIHLLSEREREREREWQFKSEPYKLYESYDRPLALPMPSDSFTTFCLLQSL